MHVRYLFYNSQQTVSSQQMLLIFIITPWETKETQLNIFSTNEEIPYVSVL